MNQNLLKLRRVTYLWTTGLCVIRPIRQHCNLTVSRVGMETAIWWRGRRVAPPVNLFQRDLEAGKRSILDEKMRLLPRQPSERQRKIIEAVKDFYGFTDTGKQEFSRNVALFLMGRKKRLTAFSEEEKTALWHIRQNLTDNEYVNGL